MIESNDLVKEHQVNVFEILGVDYVALCGRLYICKEIIREIADKAARE